jgi:type II secretory pathway component PulK
VIEKTKLRGSILVMALWALSILSIFALLLGASVRQKLTLGDRLDTFDTLQSIAYSGVEQGRSLLKADVDIGYDALTKEWARKSPSFKETKMAGGSFSLGDGSGLVDEERKINLNTADAATLSLLVQKVAALDKEKADEIAYDIIDWRDSDSACENPSYCAENDYYENLSVPYSAKNSNFESLDELLLVKGVNRGIFDKLKPFVTAYGSGVVNINTAPKEVLMALGLSETTVGKILGHLAGPDKIFGTPDDIAFLDSTSILTDMDKDVLPLDAGERTALGNLISVGKIGVVSSFFTARVDARIDKGGVVMEMEAVMDRQGKIFCLRSSGVQWLSKASV